ncbi:MAG: S8 family serine peptidase [Pseudoxanthomonas sp.]
MKNETTVAETGLRVAIALALASGLAACGGGGGNVKSTPAESTVVGFTATIANDSSLTQVNPPTLPTQAAAATLPEYSQHLEVINAAGALGAGLTGQGVTIGLLDTGVNRNHPALSGRVTASFINVDPSVNDTSVDDVVGHGTVVAQLAAGESVGNWGGGVAQQANIVSSRIIYDESPEDDGSGEGNEILAGEGYGDFFRELNAQLADAGAKIINNSWGGLYWNDPALTTELATAWKDFVVTRGGIVVFATGNEGSSEPSDNAALPSLAADAALEKGWLAVTAVDPDNPDQLDSYVDDDGNTIVYPNACGSAMNYCLAAPGTEIFIDPDAEVGDSSYDLYQGSGTSFAAPLVSGAAAVVWSAFPYFDNDLVRQTILGAATDIGEPGVDAVFGWGLLDVSKAANGPSNFAWGDVSVSFSGNSVWRNEIVGSGGLTKSGSGILTLAAAAAYTGDTRVQAGGLDVRQGLASDLYVSSGATVWASGDFGGDVANSGNFFNGASSPAAIAGDFSQSSSGNLGVWLGSVLNVGGSASLAGQLSILGVKTGYTTTARETLLTATGGVSGTFASVKAAPNVFLDASVSYDTNNVFLDISRIDVSKAVAGMGLSSITLVSAARVETAMQAIDGQLAAGGSGISAGFIDAAGALQQVTGVAQADRALRSLSGELHAAADANALAAIDANRRALSSRFDRLTAQPRLQGNWSQALGEPGQGGFGIGRFQSSGWLVGSDLRLGMANNAVAGFAFGETSADGGLADGRGDRSHERQTQAQFYTGGVRGNAYAMAQLGAGRFERQLRRELWLGDQRTGVASEYDGDFFSAGFEAGYRFGHGASALTPYAGIDYLRMEREGFLENGAEGFGLKANASTAERTQAIAGLRAERRWNRFGLHGFVEWQQSLSERGLLIDASFTGVESWSPLQGEGYSRSSGLFGFGADARLGRNARLSFGYDQRVGSLFDDRQWTAKLRYGF